MCTIHVGDCRDLLRAMPAESVHCVVTSPPYWGLRDYGVAGQLGLERTPDEYVAVMVDVFREVRRVLRADGTLWLNLGDCYATGAGRVGESPGGGSQGARWRGERSGHEGKHTYRNGMGPMTQPNRLSLPGLKPKDLVGIPWRVAFALQADGWWLRSDIVWEKPNAMPDSTTDRPTRSHEYIFLLSQSRRYYYDAEAVKEPVVSDHPSGNGFKRDARLSYRDGAGARGNDSPWDVTESRNRRSVWTIPTRPFPGAHFATMPPDLVEPCILAGCPAGGTVLDPFAGAGTVGMVALRHGRSFVGLELNPKYAELARRRIVDDAPLLNHIAAGAL